jgi:hypothetical protein
MQPSSTASTPALPLQGFAAPPPAGDVLPCNSPMQACPY